MTESPVAAETAPGPAPASPVDARERWRTMVSGVLARSGRPSADPERALTSTTLDGLELRPLYTAADAPYPPAALPRPGRAPFVRGAVAGAQAWDVRQRHAAAGGNPAILDDLAHGVTSVWLDVVDPDDVAAALDGVALDATPLVLCAGADPIAAAQAVLALAGSSVWRGNVGADPIGWGHRAGTSPALAEAVSAWRLSENHHDLRAIAVDSTVYHDAGATDADELAVATAAGVAYLRALTEAGVSMENALLALEFRLAVTDDQFASIAKLRAARWMWNRVGELCGAPERVRGQRQHAVTSSAMMTRRDPYSNVLRTTLAAFAAVVGAAQAVTVAPFGQALGRPDALGRRIARNTQAVLHDEVNLNRVGDPGGGSWYVESRTHALARRAWETFTALERDGGATNLAAVAELVGAGRERRNALIAAGDFPITGVNRFVDDTAALLTDESPTAQGIPGGLARIRYAQADEAVGPT